MGQVRRKSTKTTHAVKAALQLSQASLVQPSRELRTIREANVERFHSENHDQLRCHRDDFLAACEVARWLTTQNGLTHHE
jgi:hypothetical protein